MPLTLRRTPHAALPTWLAALLVGAAIGALVLGVGGRLAMRAVSLWEGRPRLFSLGGSLTVVAWGAGLGAAAGLLRAALEAGVARWTPASPGRGSARSGAVAVTLGVTLLLLTPWSVPRLALFPPLVLAFLAAFELAWRRWRQRAAP